MPSARSSSQRSPRALVLAALSLVAAAAWPDVVAPRSQAQSRGRTAAAFVPAAAVVAVAGPRARTWALHLLQRGARRLINLRLRMDVGGSGSLFDGTTSPLLSPDGRWLAYRVSRQLRVRDLRDGSERAVLATLGREGGGQAFAFALDSSSLLYFDYTHLEDADGTVDEDFGPSYEGFHRIVLLETGEVRDMPLEGEGEEPLLLENSGSLLVVEPSSGGVPGRHLVRVGYDPSGDERTRLASSRDSMGFGQLVGAHGQLAWIDASRIVVSGRNAEGAQAITPQGAFGEYQRPGFGPTPRAMIYEHMQRTPPSGGATFTLHARIVHLDRDAGVRTPLYDCSARCSAFLEDERNVLVHDGTSLVRVGLDRRVTRIRGGARAVAFAGLR